MSQGPVTPSAGFQQVRSLTNPSPSPSSVSPLTLHSTTATPSATHTANYANGRQYVYSNMDRGGIKVTSAKRVEIIGCTIRTLVERSRGDPGPPPLAGQSMRVGLAMSTGRSGAETGGCDDLIIRDTSFVDSGMQMVRAFPKKHLIDGLRFVGVGKGKFLFVNHYRDYLRISKLRYAPTEDAVDQTPPATVNLVRIMHGVRLVLDYDVNGRRIGRSFVGETCMENGSRLFFSREAGVGEYLLDVDGDEWTGIAPVDGVAFG